MAKDVFARTKTHVNVGTIGHIDHGKTTLTAAIVMRQAFKGLKSKLTESKEVDPKQLYAKIAKGGTVRDDLKTVTIAVAHVEYETDKRHYAHIDCPGTVGTGRIERGKVKVGDEVEIVGLTKLPRKTVVTGVEMFNKTLEYGMAGDNVGVLLRGIERTDLERGQVLAKPASITPHTKFEADVYVLSKEEGGRHTPFFSGYRPQFYFRTTDVTGNVTLTDGVEMCMPGDNIKMTVEL